MTAYCAAQTEQILHLCRAQWGFIVVLSWVKTLNWELVLLYTLSTWEWHISLWLNSSPSNLHSIMRLMGMTSTVMLEHSGSSLAKVTNISFVLLVLMCRLFFWTMWWLGLQNFWRVVSIGLLTMGYTVVSSTNVTAGQSILRSLIKLWKQRAPTNVTCGTLPQI